MPYLRRHAALPAPKADIDSLAGFRGRQDLFGQPALAGDNRYADMLRGYLRSETIAPLPLQRLAAAYPDAVFSFAYSARNSFPIARRATGYILPGQPSQAGAQRAC